MIKINSTIIEMGRFPNGERSFSFDPGILSQEGNVVTFKYEGDSSIFDLILVKREMDAYLPHAQNVLVIAYMPYSRLDRESENVVFTLKYVGDLINSLNFTGVVVLEPHSDVTCAILNGASGFDMTQALFKEVCNNGVLDFDPKVDAVCYPDATAQKRYSKGGDWNGIVGMKNRDFKTGWIKSLDIYCPEGYDVKDKNVVILDDLCSKGGTFILTARELRKLGAKSITLVVAHCEATILDGEVLTTDLIDKVITSNTIITHEQAGDNAVTGKMWIRDFEEFI